MPGKHIVFIVENLSVPFDRRVWREANALKSSGYEVSVICPLEKTKDKEKRITLNGISIYRYYIPPTQSSKLGYVKEYSKAFFSTLYLLFKINFNKKVNAIHVANPPEIFFPLGWLGKILRFKFIYDQHDLSPETYLVKFKVDKNNKMYRLLLLMEKLTFKASDFIFSTNESIRKVGIERNNYPIERSAIVRNGPDKDFQITEPDIKLKNGKKYLAAYLGVMGKMDGVEYIINAADYIVNVCKYYDIYFILAGFGDEFDNHKKLIKKLNLEGFISMPGRLYDKDIKPLLSTADICLAPDPANGLNEYLTMNKVMDYMRFGKPIVSFDLKESRFSAEDSAVYVENNNYVEFGMSIMNILKEPEKMSIMGKKGIERIDKHLKWENSVDILLDKYKEILK